jgi:hypothetical protein
MFLIVACTSKDNSIKEQKFDKAKWLIKKENQYPYRDKMLKDFISSYKLNGYGKDSLLNLLGEPERVENGHLYYPISQTYLPNTTFPLHTKTLVVKLTAANTVEWRKIHE